VSLEIRAVKFRAIHRLIPRVNYEPEILNHECDTDFSLYLLVRRNALKRITHANILFALMIQSNAAKIVVQ